MVQVLREGYCIPFVGRPPLSESPIVFASYSPNSERGRALEEEVRTLIRKGAIESAPHDPGFYSRIFVVPKVTGGFRPVIDLSVLNKFIPRMRFRMETNASVLSAIRRGDWMMSVDLQDAYFQIPIHSESRKYLRFVWEGQSFQFKVVCFGLSTAPQVFTRVMAPVSAVLHARGIRLLRYLDDWLLLATSVKEALRSRDVLLQLCEKLHITINWKKSELVPSQVAQYLGMEIHSSVSKVFPSLKRVDNLLEVIELFTSQCYPPVQEWLVLLGHLSSMSHLVPGGRRRMRNLQFQLAAFWDRRTMGRHCLVPVTTVILDDLQWWSTRDNLLAGQSLETPIPDLLLYTDASSEGWGAYSLDKEASGEWSHQEKQEHINLLELRAIRLGLQSFEESLRGKTVAILSDNTTALSFISKEGGTRSSSLNREAQETLQWMEENAVTVLTQFVRGETNVVADCLSRKGQVISTEWTLHQTVCDNMWKVWGCPLVDLFATRMNYRLPNFVSPFHDPMAIATDAFLFQWDFMEMHAFPPFHVIRKVLNKLHSLKGAKLILVRGLRGSGFLT